MARITIDDCLVRIPSRFHLTMVAACRAHELAQGATPLIDVGNSRDKPTVIALREIAEGLIDESILEKHAY